MIKAVIFDCFGVLTSDGWLALREKYITDADKLEQANAANKRVDAGLIGYDDFMAIVAKLAGISTIEARNIIEGNHANLALFDYIRDNLDGKYKIGLLSNAGANWLDRLFTPEQNKLFDEIVLSYEVGVVKPDPLMYQTIANKLGVLPEECVLVDDQERYASAAGDLGMQYIHFTSTKQAIAALQEVLNA